MASERADALRVQNVHSGYGRVPVLRDVSLRIGDDESVAVIGANGAGKSTLVRTIAGLLPVTAGAISVAGVAVERLPPHERVQCGLGVVLENRALFGELSVRENLELAHLHGRKFGREERFTFDGVLDLFPFMRQRLDAPVELLSGGEQQMVAIGRALLVQPQLLLLDEISTGLAPKVLRQIVGTIQKLRGRGLAVLLVEQNVALAAEIADRGYVMSLGRIIDEVPQEKWKRIEHDEALLKAYLGA